MNLRTRIIPCLLLKNKSLVKTVNFKKYKYIGDPCNTVRIFNELEVDELLFLDITATKENKEPDYSLLNDIASECFMPLSYGGGVRSVEQARKILNIGFEKICINSAAFDNLTIVSEISKEFGTQAVIGSIDYKKSFFGRTQVFNSSKNKFTGKDIVDWAKTLADVGVGEILLTAIEKEGTWQGYDLKMIKQVASSINVPLIANGGCGKLDDIRTAIFQGASAVATGSMVVYQKKDMGVLINFPDREKIEEILK